MLFFDLDNLISAEGATFFQVGLYTRFSYNSDKQQAPLLLDGSEIIESRDSGSYVVDAQVLDYKKPAVFRQLLAASAGFADPEKKLHYLTKATHPGYRKLADTALKEYAIDEQGIRSDYLRAVAISRWLTEHGHRMPVNNTVDPQSLLNGSWQGSNNQFAQAATLAMRSIDLPARVAYGYAVPMSARAQERPLFITADQSHAWPEVHIKGFRWLPVDTCPPATNEQLY